MVATSNDGSRVIGDRPGEPWRQLHRYWLSKHVDGRPPARADIDPITEIPRLVANLMIIDSVEDGFIYRFVGTEVVSQTGEDMTGRHVGLSRKYGPIRSTWIGALEFVRAKRQPQLLESFDAVRDEQTPRLLKSGVSASCDHATAVTIVLPLVTNTGETEKLLVGVFYDRRFDAIDQVDYLDMSRPPI